MTFALRPSIIVIAAFFGFTAGCNSHASFQNNENNQNNGSCGNSSLDVGEECDRNSSLGDLFPEGTTCLSLGFSGGQLKCKSDCKIDTGDCAEPLPCNPLTPYENCEEPMDCYLMRGTNEIGCFDHDVPFDKEVGVSCGESYECRPGLFCYDAGDELGPLCRELCAAGQKCGVGLEDCQDRADILMGFGVCPFTSGPCDPVSGSGCPVGNSCYIIDSNGNVECAPTGIKASFNICDSFNDCYPGNYCTNIHYPNSEYTECVPLCDQASSCSTGCSFARGSQIGLCLPSEPCDPLNVDAYCPDGMFCYVTNDLANTTCLADGVGGTGSSCNMFLYCSIGYFCDDTGNDTNVCRLLCDLGAPNCPGTCDGAGWDQAFGVCI